MIEAGLTRGTESAHEVPRSTGERQNLPMRDRSRLLSISLDRYLDNGLRLDWYCGRISHEGSTSFDPASPPDTPSLKVTPYTFSGPTSGSIILRTHFTTTHFCEFDVIQISAMLSTQEDKHYTQDVMLSASQN